MSKESIKVYEELHLSILSTTRKSTLMRSFQEIGQYGAVGVFPECFPTYEFDPFYDSYYIARPLTYIIAQLMLEDIIPQLRAQDECLVTEYVLT